MNLVGSGKTVCPYYLREKERGIVCCSHDGRVKAVILCFGSEQEKKDYQDDFCFCECYRGCPVACSAEFEAERES